MGDRSKTTADIARKSGLLSVMPAEAAERLIDQASTQSVRHGATLFAQGDPAHAIFIVIEGSVKIYRITESGAEAVVGVFGPGNSFAEAAALRSGTYPVFAEAVTDALLMKIRAHDVLGLLRSDPDIAVAALSATYLHLHELVSQVAQLKARTGPQRIATFLLALSAQTSGSVTVRLPYDKALIAGQLGMSPASLSRAFARLRDCGVVIRRDAAEIADLADLRDFANGDRAKAWRSD